MKFENLHEGQVFKNYKELCATLEIEPTDGSSKRAQFKDLDTYCLYHKEGHKIIIDEIFDEQNFNKLIQLLEWAWNVVCQIMKKCNASIPTKIYNIDVYNLFRKLK